MENQLKIGCDNGPLLSFLQLLKVAKIVIDFNNLGCEFARVESDYSSAVAGEMTVRFYPSDGLLRHVSALLAKNVEIEIIKPVDHAHVQLTPV